MRESEPSVRSSFADVEGLTGVESNIINSSSSGGLEKVERPLADCECLVGVESTMTTLSLSAALESLVEMFEKRALVAGFGAFFGLFYKHHTSSGYGKSTMNIAYG